MIMGLRREEETGKLTRPRIPKKKKKEKKLQKGRSGREREKWKGSREGGGFERAVV